MRSFITAWSARDRTPSVAALGPVALALLLGLIFVLGAGFASIPAAHNAAHDARHSFAFPCH